METLSASDHPKWEAFAAIAQQCATRFDETERHSLALEARQLRADFLWAASDPVRAKRGVIEQWSTRLRELIAESRNLSDSDKLRDSEKSTPRQSGTLQMAPDFAVEARDISDRLVTLHGTYSLARDKCADPDVSSELSARILSAEELIDTLGEYADDLESWGMRDPGPDQRPMRINRLAQALRRANDLLNATPPHAASVEHVVMRKSKWPF